jgi:glucokinase
MKEPVTITADIGGTHITAAQLNMLNKQLIAPTLVRKPVNAMASVQEVIQVWATCMQQAAGAGRIEKISLAMPGPFDYAKGICLIQDQGKYPMLYGKNVKTLLAAALSVHAANIYMHNDAACFLQGEAAAGSVQGYQTVIGITLGTGLGSAIYKDGVAQSADLWKMPFGDGIAEEYLCTRWFVQRYASITGNTVGGVKELAAMWKANEQVQQLFNEFGSNLGLFVQRFLAGANSEAVVIGGNIAQAFPLFSPSLVKSVHRKYPGVFVAPGILGEQAALIGAGSFLQP